LVGELRRAIERGELILHYQPKAELRSGRVQWVEALVRWDHPTRGRLFPDEFIPLAEQTGLIRPLTAWVLDEALTQTSAWLVNGLRLGVAVNLSARNLHDGELPGQVQELLHKHSFPPALLKVEITESSLVVDPERAMHILSRLRAMGVQVAIDDFGVGYSSLAYLKKLPVTELKIDRSFIQQMVVNRHDAAIVRSTIDLSHELGLEVVAEGVEDEATWDLLYRLGCDVVQGNLISSPLSPAELAEWLPVRPRSTWTEESSPGRGQLLVAVPA
jgi:EAL domain-containing protein (putative c-di-GMP-specific phosphodiesterase class I)